MKNIKIFAALFAVILLASCNRKVEFEHETFATFYQSTVSVNEDTVKLNVPVKIYNPTGADVQVTVTAVDGTAVGGGTDYEILSPATGILNFSGNTDSLAIEIAITNDPEFTGAKSFQLQIASSIGVGNFSTATVTINDLNHPLAGFIGAWEGVIAGRFQNPSYPTLINIIADEKDDTYTKLIFDTGIDPFFFGMGMSTAVYSAVAVSETEVAVLGEQPNGYDDVVLVGYGETDTDIHFVLGADGKLTLITTYGCYTEAGGGNYEVYDEGAVFTKK